MDRKRVKDLMVPLEEYAVVNQEATLLEAIQALDKAQENLPTGRQPYRAVLVDDAKGSIVGKIGQLAFLKALEPKYNLVGDMGSLVRAGVSSEFISSMMDHFRFFQENLSDMCSRARTIRVKDVMHSATESIDENATLGEAIHSIVTRQTLSLLVTRGTEIVGLLRLSELYDEVAKQIREKRE